MKSILLGPIVDLQEDRRGVLNGSSFWLRVKRGVVQSCLFLSENSDCFVPIIFI